MNKFIRFFLIFILAATLLTLTACDLEADVSHNHDLSREFMEKVMANDFESAFGMVKATVEREDFTAYWVEIQAAVEGATTYELENTGWNINSTNGLTTRSTTYNVTLDNGRTVLLRVVTQSDTEGIAGIQFKDITGFLESSNRAIPTVRIILWVVAALSMAFTVWMLIDCIRRKMKYKAIWIILILMGIALTVTVGEVANLNFTVGLFFSLPKIEMDASRVSVVAKTVLPVGAILYLCLRNRFTEKTPPPESEPQAPAEGEEV